jgi:hypothetical protein
MPRWVRVLVAIAIGAPLVASSPGPAVACDCARVDPHRIVKQADAIVAGHVLDVVTFDPTRTMSSIGVDGVYEGRVGATVTVRSDIGPAGGSDCTVLYPVGSQIDPLVLLRQPDQTYLIDICAMPMAGQVSKLLGTARPPPADGPPAAPLPTKAAPAPVVAAETAQQRVSWPAVGAGALLALALITFAVLRSARGAAAERVGVEADEEASDADDPPTEDPSG